MVELGWQTHVLGRGRLFESAAEAYDILRQETEDIDQDLPPLSLVVTANRWEKWKTATELCYLTSGAIVP